MNTHQEQWAAIYAAAPGEQLGVRCLAQGHLSRGIEGGECWTFTPPPTIPAGPRIELTTFGLQSDSLIIRPQLSRLWPTKMRHPCSTISSVINVLDSKSLKCKLLLDSLFDWNTKN